MEVATKIDDERIQVASVLVIKNLPEQGNSNPINIEPGSSTGDFNLHADDGLLCVYTVSDTMQHASASLNQLLSSRLEE